ncbi:lactadherin [Plakobranchus ocellatus]|uniref:Lactadherin n=1 Tax=Plakobranchus ocellatus TaxID=259542 RepID=A0AAV3Y031_9GAST|nr:lactadherin [Plakobranchus ocellatus]
MITGAISDWQITASTTYPSEWDRACHEKYARVYLPNKLGWCAKYKSASEWLQVDLGVAARVTGVMTQGRGDGSEWVSRFKVSYSMDAYHWSYVTDNYGNQWVSTELVTFTGYPVDRDITILMAGVIERTKEERVRDGEEGWAAINCLMMISRRIVSL